MGQVLKSKLPNFLIRLVLLGAIVVQLFTTTALAATSGTCAGSFCAYLPSVQVASPFRLISRFTGSGHTGPQYIQGELINISTQTYANIQLRARLFNKADEFIGILTGTVLTERLLPGQLSPYLLDQYISDVPRFPIYRFEIEPISLTLVTTPTYKLLEVSIDRPDPSNRNIVTYQIHNNSSETVYQTLLYVWSPQAPMYQIGAYSMGDLAPKMVVTRTFENSFTSEILRGTASGFLLP